MRPGIIDVAANFRAQLDHRLMHLGLDLLLEGNFAVLKNLVNVRAQLASFGIDDGKFFLDAKGEDMLFDAHFTEQQCPKICSVSSRGSARSVRCGKDSL